MWLLDNKSILKAVNKLNHVDRIAFSLATYKLSLPVQNFNFNSNSSIHSSDRECLGFPYFIHDWQLTNSNKLLVKGTKDSEYTKSMKAANKIT